MCKRRVFGINTDEDGCCRCLKAGYYKMGWTNFTREILGYTDGFVATAIMEVYEERSAENTAGD